MIVARIRVARSQAHDRDSFVRPGAAFDWQGDHDGIARVVTDEMLQIEGIINSETLIAFRVYSQHDLERMFSIGLE